MKTYIALFRGINVGGRNIIPMKELTLLMKECGYENIRTYIQSGNVVFEAPGKNNSEIGTLVEAKFGFKPEVLLLSSKDLSEAIKNNPYSGVEGKLCHFYFCKSNPESINNSRLSELKTASEEYFFKGKVFYLYAPDGIGRSKLAAKIEACLGVTGTARNLNTVNKLSLMLNNA